MNVFQRKIRSPRSIVTIAKRAKRLGKKVVTTNGCFDIIHAGHVATLEWAKKQGDVLIVGVNSDASVRSRVNKGPLRPIVSANDRARVLAGLATVDYVFIFNTTNPIPWLKKVKPDIYVKGRGSELDPRFAPEKKLVEASGGRVVLAPKVHARSTTDIIQTILDRYGEKSLR